MQFNNKISLCVKDKCVLCKIVGMKVSYITSQQNKCCSLKAAGLISNKSIPNDDNDETKYGQDGF